MSLAANKREIKILAIKQNGTSTEKKEKKPLPLMRDIPLGARM